MKSMERAILVALLAAMAMASTGCNKLKARDQLNKGVQAYKGGKYEDAIEKFKNAVALDPDLGVDKLYLATAYVGQYDPRVDTLQNNHNAELNIQQYQQFLQTHAN